MNHGLSLVWSSVRETCDDSCVNVGVVACQGKMLGFMC